MSYLGQGLDIQLWTWFFFSLVQVFTSNYGLEIYIMKKSIVVCPQIFCDFMSPVKFITNCREIPNVPNYSNLPRW